MILRPFNTFAAEAAIIARLSAGYTTLEVDLMHCVQVVRNDLDAVLKAMFRVRGETPRIHVAEGLGWHHYDGLGLSADFEAAIRALRFCLRIRNQYAHSVWYDNNTGQLAFVNLEEIAKDNEYVENLDRLTVKYVDVPLLERQEAFFVFTDQLFSWTNHEGRRLSGKLERNPIPRPEVLAPPGLHVT